MKFIVCYDIKEDKIRSRVVKYLEERAFRIQFSVFSLKCDAKKIKEIWQKLLTIVKTAENPLLMIIPVCKNCDKSILSYGKPLEEDKVVIVL